MANERKTEQLTRDLLQTAGYTKANGFHIEEQQSDNPRISKCLKNASKGGNGTGRPEFIITKSGSETLIVVECKAENKFHQSETLNQAKDYAVDGAIHYASYLSKEYDVIALGISGETEQTLRLDTYSWVKGDTQSKSLNLQDIKPFETYEQIISGAPEKVKIQVSELMSYAKDLHNQMRDYAKLEENQKPLLVSGILISLQHRSFEKNYLSYDDKELPEILLGAIEKVLKKSDIPEDKRRNLMSVWSFIGAKEEFKKEDNFLGVNPLKHIIHGIDQKVRPFVTEGHSVDVIGKFYGEFLKYSGGDGKGLGIVLTPHHITDLFADLADLTPKSVVLDICTGTGGFLISAMKNMFDKANGDERLIENIKRHNLIGVEQQPNMYALACSNMILRGDGKANLYMGSCFGLKNELKTKDATIGLLNPPYSQKVKGLLELDFIDYMLDCLTVGGYGFAIVPMSCAIESKKDTVASKERILSKHRLVSVMSMPDELFYPTGVVTCIMVFQAHVPHNKEIESWFGYWKNDGFVKTKKDGRIDQNQQWEATKKDWLNMYRSQKEIPGLSVKQSVTAKDEWCAEAYMQTDYSKLTKESFEQGIKHHIFYKLMNGGE